MWNLIWVKIKSLLTKYWPIIVVIGLFTGIYLQSSNNSFQRRLLERNFAILQSDVNAVKEEQRELRKYNAELTLHATKLDEWITKYGQEIDKLGKFNTESRRELASIRADIRATKTELSTAIEGVQGDIGNLTEVQGNLTEDGKLYDEMERRLRELAERYGIDLTK